jgi:hypothetical protein
MSFDSSCPPWKLNVIRAVAVADIGVAEAVHRGRRVGEHHKVEERANAVDRGIGGK